MKFILSALLFIFTLPVTALAQPDIRADVTSKSIRADEELVYRIVAQWRQSEASYTFQFPVLKLQNLELLKQGESQESFVRNGEVWVKKSFKFTLKPIKAGRAQILGFDFNYIDPSQQKGGASSINTQTVTIRPLPQSTTVSMPILIGLGLVILLATLFSVHIFRKRAVQNGDQASSTSSDLSARLEQDLPKDQIAEEWTCVFDNFIQHRYDVDLSRHRGANLDQVLREHGVSKRSADHYHQIHRQLEELKYSGIDATDFELRELKRELQTLIENQQPVIMTNESEK